MKGQFLSLVAYHAKSMPPTGWAFAPVTVLLILLPGLSAGRGGSHESYIAYETGGPRFICFICLLTLFLLLTESLTMKPDVNAAMLAFPLTRAIDKRLFIRARIVLAGGLLALPCLISLIHSFAQPDLRLPLAFSNREMLEYWIAKPSHASGRHQARQLLYLERLPRVEAVDVPILMIHARAHVSPHLAWQTPKTPIPGFDKPAEAYQTAFGEDCSVTVPVDPASPIRLQIRNGKPALTSMLFSLQVIFIGAVDRNAPDAWAPRHFLDLSLRSDRNSRVADPRVPVQPAGNCLSDSYSASLVMPGRSLAHLRRFSSRDRPPILSAGAVIQRAAEALADAGRVGECLDGSRLPRSCGVS